MSAYDAPTLDRVPELRLGVAGVALLVLTAAVHVARADAVVATVVFVVATAGCCAVLRAAHAALLGVTAWALLTGFVINTLGQLTLAPTDLARLGALVALAVLASAAGPAVRKRPARRPASPYSQPFLRKAA